MEPDASVHQRSGTANCGQHVAPGTLIIANIPLPPDVFRELKSQAASSHQTTTQLMAAILTRAAGDPRRPRARPEKVGCIFGPRRGLPPPTFPPPPPHFPTHP